MSAVRERLREHPLPGEAEAATRTWPVVEAALAERIPRGGRRPRPLLRLALVTALLAAALLAALSPAGADVGHWIGDRFAAREEPAAPSFAALPKGGSVLAISRTAAYAVSPDGATQWLGSFTEAGWSPRGLHVVGVNGNRLTAVDPLGTIKWTRVRRGPVHDPAWSTGDGFAVAYLERSALRVVAGNGDPATDRRVRGGAAPVTPAWRSGSDRVLSYSRAGGTIETVDVTTGRTLWETPARARSLHWSANGRRLVALLPRSVAVLDSSGRVLRRVALPRPARELALHPSGRRAAVAVGHRVLEVRLAGAKAGATAPLFQGDIDGLAWSQNGSRLLLGWRGAGQWLLLGPGGRIRPLHDVGRELGSAGGFPRVAGWCCAS
jgi:hypothetical protein